MLKNKKILILVFLISILCIVTCYASGTVPINDLIEKAFAMENKEVTVQGETIGEALERDEYAWININDNTNAIGVWVKLDELTQIKYYGDYKNKGDIVKVTGVFHRACTEHGGDVDIHCSKIEIVENRAPYE